jgi:HTH-type transcriptional regulator / antitoxin HigA
MMDEALAPDWFSKPADSLLSLMRRRDLTIDELSGQLEGGKDYLRGLLAGTQAINEGAARIFAHAIGGSPGFWLRRQSNYEAALARAAAATEADGDNFLDEVPAPGPRARGARPKSQEIGRRLAFFDVNSLEGWRSRYGGERDGFDFRTTRAFTSDEGSVALWLRQGEIEAQLVDTKPWNPEHLLARLPDIRKLSRLSDPARFLPRLRAMLAEAGVALVIVKSPQGCRASGACRFIARDKAMVLLSFRYRVDDQFWFTLFHELGHILLHGGTFVDGDESPEDAREAEANAFASSQIVPEVRLREFESLPPFRDDIIRFAVSVRVAPGLIVGQMQHRGMLPRDRQNGLKRHWTWSQIEPALA